MTSEKIRKQVLNSFLRTVEGIANIEYQKKIWVRGEGPEVDDFDETVCYFFQDVDEILEKYNEFGLTEDQFRSLKRFRDCFQAFSEENDFPHLFIDSPEWVKIVCMAKNFLKSFNYS